MTPLKAHLSVILATDHNAILFYSDKNAIFPKLYREISLTILKIAISKLVLARREGVSPGKQWFSHNYSVTSRHTPVISDMAAYLFWFVN